MMIGLTILACSVCFGDPKASATQGMNMGILFMLGVTAVVLGCCGAGFIALARRARRQQQLEAGLSPSLEETQT